MFNHTKRIENDINDEFMLISINELRAILDKVLLHAMDNQPIIIFVNGSVAVGKTTFSEQLRDYFVQQQQTVQIVHTDAFLLSNKVLLQRQLMNKKGFPYTYQQERLLETLQQIKARNFPIRIPTYSHQTYNIGEKKEQIQAADIFIVEGIGFNQLFAPDLIDLSIFLDAKIDVIKSWYMKRTLKNIANAKPHSFFEQYQHYSENQLKKIVEQNWQEINLINYYQHILPQRIQSDIIIEKGEAHEFLKIYRKRFTTS